MLRGERKDFFRERIRTDLHETKYAVRLGVVAMAVGMSLESGRERGALAEGSVLHRGREE